MDKPTTQSDVDRLLREVFALCEATEDAPEVEAKNDHQSGFERGRRFEAKQIRKAIGIWFQDTFCGPTFMGEPIVEAPGEQDAKDAARLDWLDAQNLRFKMGWKVDKAPMGNVSISSVIFLGVVAPISIRDAVDAAMLVP